MKKLIALFAVSAVASTSAVAGIALSGTASVSYDDNGSSPSATTYDADLTLVVLQAQLRLHNQWILTCSRSNFCYIGNYYWSFDYFC